MDYTASGAGMTAAGTGTLAYTGANDGTLLFTILALVVIALGVGMLFIARQRSRRDAIAAGIDSESDLGHTTDR